MNSPGPPRGRSPEQFLYDCSELFAFGCSLGCRSENSGGVKGHRLHKLCTHHASVLYICPTNAGSPLYLLSQACEVNQELGAPCIVSYLGFFDLSRGGAEIPSHRTYLRNYPMLYTAIDDPSKDAFLLASPKRSLCLRVSSCTKETLLQLTLRAAG
jgi:hypothetical protein